ncbi:response regulator transcription factor [Rhodovastum atsumiense]|uniref:response regulator transcription factor n=1 Tax=Rhodovastum atsumiense TaxID=504468 RepID=UPI00139F2C2F|nr:response regulator transcription factor [Rhodovastum atsumiense]
MDSIAITRECLLHMVASRPGGARVEGVPDASIAVMEQPDLVLVYARATPVDKEPVIRQFDLIRSRYGPAPIVVIADLDDHECMLAAFRHAARGYVPTTLPRLVVVAAIELVLAGGTFVPEQIISRHLVPSVVPVDPPPSEPASPATGPDMLLTTRETDVLQLLREGKPNKVIAYALQISESTVKVHVRNIMKKLRATNRTQVALFTHVSCAGSAAVTAVGT